MSSPRMQRDWVGKTLAGALLGLCLAFACSAVFARLAAGLAPPIKAQLAMWMVVPIWFSVLASSYSFASGRRAWGCLGAANVIVVGLLAALRSL